MADAVDLAGVIGTWVAVFLAIVALLGLLPAYILYRRSRTEKAQALSRVDDPNHMYTSIFRVFGAVVRYSARVPDLRYSPDFHTLEEAHLSGLVIGSTKSRTSWIEFALVMNAAFPNARLDSADLLVFEHGQSYLPVSKAWLLALGVLYRVAIRQDHGLPLGADVDTSSPSTFPEPRLSGVSGYLDRTETGPSRSEKLGDAVSGHEYHKVGRWPASRGGRRRNPVWDVWMLRKEVHRWGFVYLQVKPSPRGFLFDRERDFIISMILGFKTVGKLLGLAKTWLPSLGLAKEQQTLADLEVISEFDLINISCSRRLIQAIASVDETIDEVLKNEGVMWEFVRTIHACDNQFRESVEKYLERIHAGEQEPKFALDLERGMMTVPQADGCQQDQSEFEIDFEHTIAETKPRHNLRTAGIESAHVVLACLQGQLRVVAWNMTSSPEGLLDLVQANRSRDNDGFYYVSSNRFRSMQHHNSWIHVSEVSSTSSSFSIPRPPRPHHSSDTQSSRDHPSEVIHRELISISIEGLERGDEES